MQTRTRNSIALAAATVAMSAGLVVLAQHRRAPDRRFRALAAVPRSALLVAVADLDTLRASPVGAPFLKQGREIPGLGKVRDLCGFDPIDGLKEIALAVPESGQSGDFGLIASGTVDEKALIACATKVIEGRGGRPIVTTIGTFHTVRDGSLSDGGGEIAVRDGGPLLLGAGSYLRAMIDAAERRSPTIEASDAHTWLARETGVAQARITVVLSKAQREAFADEQRLIDPTSPTTSVFGGALGIELGPTVTLHGIIACDGAESCGRLARNLESARVARAADLGTRLVGFGALLDQVRIEPQNELIHLRVGLPAAEAAVLAERVIALRGLRHPMPEDAPPAPPAPPSETSAQAPRERSSTPDEVIGVGSAQPAVKAPGAGK